MAQKTEQLPKERLELLINSQTKANELILSLGQVHLRIRELNNQIAKLEESKLEIETEIDSSSKQFSEIIKSLEVQYPQGEVDLNQGIVTYESPE
jgi:predicted nuclease with TOPRIM domain